MKESEYILVRNLTNAGIATTALREITLDRDSEDWQGRAAAIDWLYDFVKKSHGRLGDMEEG